MPRKQTTGAGSLSIISSASTSVTGGRRNTTSWTSSARTPPRRQTTNGPSRRVGGDTDQHLDASRHLALEEDAVEGCADGGHAGRERAGRIPRVGSRLQTDDHTTDIALVEDARRNRLRDERIPQAVRGRRDIRHRRDLGVGHLEPRDVAPS